VSHMFWLQPLVYTGRLAYGYTTAVCMCQRDSYAVWCTCCIAPAALLSSALCLLDAQICGMFTPCQGQKKFWLQRQKSPLLPKLSALLCSDPLLLYVCIVRSFMP
jgi:hypothetical protein